jgi:hypothetical protein
MQLIQRWLGKSSAPRYEEPTGCMPQGGDARRELLAMTVRDVLREHGIPPHWIVPETRPAAKSTKLRGMHLRLVVRECDPELPAYAVALQKAIRARLLRLDSRYSEWMLGISWKFDLKDEGAWPSLPPRQYWQGEGVNGF